MFVSGRLASRMLKSTILSQRRTVFNSEKFWVRENIPFYGLCVGTAAISFQIGVLYPWHEVLSQQISRLEAVILSVENLSTGLESRVNEMEAKVLKKEAEILERENAILKKLDESKTKKN